MAAADRRSILLLLLSVLLQHRQTGGRRERSDKEKRCKLTDNTHDRRVSDTADLNVIQMDYLKNNLKIVAQSSSNIKNGWCKKNV